MSVNQPPMENGEPRGAPVRSKLMRELYFPTLIYYADLPGAKELNDTIKPHIYAWRAQDQEGIVRSNVKQLGAWHSRVDMHEREEYRELSGQILAAARTIAEDLGYDPTYQVVFDNMWANINPRYAYNRGHVHPNALWSGVYYVQAPAGSGRIFFTEPRPQAQMVAPKYRSGVPRRQEAWSEVYYEPIEGRLILFPAWLVHEVEPNLSNEEGPAGDRISVSFNIFQRRPQAPSRGPGDGPKL
jgi:uncharacterized protein (TIGR02466 family)